MKDEDSTKVKIDTKIDFTILDNENLQIVTSHQSAFNDIVAARQVEVMRLKDEGIRQALVKLGWTPPGMAPSIHEDNVRSLQGIIDDLRIILGAADGERITDAARRAATKRPAQATQVDVTDDLVEKARVETFQKTGADLIPEVAATFARAILAQPAEGGEPYYGHQFKEIRKGVWLCKCGKQITEGTTSCTNGTPNTSTQQQTADAVNATLTHADSCCAPRAQGWSIRVGSSQSDTTPASQGQAQQPKPQPMTDEQRRDLRNSLGMLDAYVECIKSTGQYEAWHYIPEIESARDELAAFLAHHGITAQAKKEQA